MIKKLAILSFLSLVVNTTMTTPAFAAELFVATDGVDDITTNNGSISQPWASLDFALDRVAPGDTINIRGGRYHESITQGNVNGTALQPITIQSYNGEQVTFDGTIPVTGSWSQHADNIYKLQLNQPVWQLFVDNEMMMNARWPNARFDDDSVYSRDVWAKGLDATTTNGRIDTDPTVHDLAASGIDATGAVVIANTRHFNSYTRLVTSHTPGSNVFDHGVTPFFWGTKSYYYLQGALSLLDQDKEWHIDVASNMAYLWAPGGGVPTGNIRARNQQFVIDANNWNYVTFKGLDFFATTIELTASESITIEDCNFNYSGVSKRALGETDAKSSLLRFTNTVGAGNFVLRNITITNSDSQAFFIKGENSVVENSLFENIDWAATESYSVSASLVFMGNNTLFSRNTIRNAGTSETIATGVAVGASSIIAEYNDIYHTGYAQSDGAQIQIRIDAQNGTVVHHNWLHDTPKYGFRFDAPIPPPEWGDSGFSHHNVVWNSSGANPKGDNARHYNNLLFGNEAVDLIVLDDVALDGDLSNEFTKTVNNAADSISGHRQNEAPVPGFVGSNFNGYGQPDLLSDLLRDPANHDFRPVAGSSLVDAGDVINDADFSHPIFGGAADLGAYEEGNSHYWIPGRKLPTSSYPIPFDAGSTTKTNADLMWREAYRATSHDIYFGTSPGSLVFQGNQSNNIYNPGILTPGKTYYWRVDAVTPAGTITGDEWSFSVAIAPVSISLSPVADAYVDDSAPDSNYGSEGVIRLVTPTVIGGGYEQRVGFLKFNIDVPGTIISAKLKLYNDQSSKNRYVNLHNVANSSWEETLITWNNQPLMGDSLQQLDILGNSWQEFDVLPAINGNGLLSLGLKRAVSDSRRQVVSKEGSFAPELIIEYVPTANNAPEFTTDTLSKSNAVEAAAYSASIAADASDADSDSLSFAKVSGPAWMSVASDGSVSGVPVASDVGLNTFTVEVNDGKGSRDTAMLNITVDAAVASNSAPVFATDTLVKTNATEAAAYSASVAADASDADSDILSFAKVSGPAWLSVASDGSVSGVPEASDVGLNTFTLEVNDGKGGSASATLHITVKAALVANQAPSFSDAVLAPITATVAQNYSGSIAAQASDAEGDDLTFSKVTGPSWVNVTANGDIAGTPSANNIGVHRLSIKVTAAGGSDEASIEITVKAASVGSDSSDKASSGGSMYYVVMMLALMCVYRRHWIS